MMKRGVLTNGSMTGVLGSCFRMLMTKVQILFVWKLMFCFILSLMNDNDLTGQRGLELEKIIVFIIIDFFLKSIFLRVLKDLFLFKN